MRVAAPLPAIAFAVLCACSGPPPAQQGAAAADPRAPVVEPAPADANEPGEAAPSVPAPRPIDGEDAALPEEVVVSTNEPFWSARVENGEILLTGAGQPERRLKVSTSGVAGAKRRIVASDGAGELVVEIASRPCQDSMSGAGFPLSGSLSFAGASPVEGCARPASMPPPPVPQ